MSGKLVVGALFAVEQLQHQHAGDRFLQEGIDARNRNPDTAIGIAHLVAEDLGRVDDERKHGKGQERKLPIHVQHDGKDEREHEYIFKD